MDRLAMIIKTKTEPGKRDEVQSLYREIGMTGLRRAARGR